MKKFLSVMLALAMIVSCVSVVAFAADTKTVVNGNAESGETGWETTFMGGTLEVVNGGANGTAHAIKYTASGTYHSVGFDVTAKIIQDEANGYNGCGAGEYTVSFYAKAEDGKEGKFKVGFDNVPQRDNASWIQDANPFTMNDEWEEYEFTINVSEEKYDVLKAQYDAGNKTIIRLDGSNDKQFEAGETFVYYIDEVVVTGPGEETDNGGATAPEVKVPTGFKITYNEETSGAHYVISKTGVFTDADVKDGEITKKFVVVNNGEEDIKVKIEFQLFHNGSWVAPVSGTPVTIEPGDSEEIEYTAEVEDGKVTVGDTEYPIAKLFVRCDMDGGSSAQLVEGTSATVYCESAIAEAIVAGARAFTSESKLELVYDKSSNSVGSGDVLPVAFIALVAVATVALVAVSKKKREEF